MEEFKVFDKDVLHDQHVCSNCKKYLNVTPIYCVEKNQTIEELCGRCVHIADSYSKTKRWRQYLFEDFGKFLTFPCSNKRFGCNVVLHWDEVLPHEKICTFRGAICPLAQKNEFPNGTCEWEGNIKNLQNHIEESHRHYIFNPLQIDWSDCKETTITFTNVGNQIVTVMIKYDKESTYYCLLMLNGSDIDSQCYRYQLELFDEFKNNSIILRKSRLESILHMAENLKNPEKMLEIDFIKLKEMLKRTKSTSGRFGIVKKSKKEIALIAGDKNHEMASPVTKPKDNVIIDEKILQELECPVCNEYMIPPIYICKTGHSICSICKVKVTICPNCRDHFSGTRNFTLEKLTQRVNYPCRNRDIGCLFVTTSDKILGHQLNCELSENPCMLNCGWQGTRLNMYTHLKIVHSNYICNLDTLQICDFKNNNESFYFLYDHGQLFRISFKQEFVDEMSAKKFNIQQIGLAEKGPKFRYQLQIIDHSPLGLNLSFTNVCQPLTNLKTAHDKAIAIPWNLLQPFVFEQHYFYYKILISKIKTD